MSSNGLWVWLKASFPNSSVGLVTSLELGVARGCSLELGRVDDVMGSTEPALSAVEALAWLRDVP